MKASPISEDTKCSIRHQITTERKDCLLYLLLRGPKTLHL